MSIDWDKFDSKVDLDGLRDDIEEAKENGGGDFKEVPVGTYEVEVEKLELTTSKKGDPMVSIWFKILDGEFTNNRIFYNQIIPGGFQIHLNNELLRSLEVFEDDEIKFESYAQYSELLLDIAEEIDALGLEYALEYGKNSKGYNTYKIVEVFETE